MDQQKEDGWICPCTVEERPGYDMWALLLLGKVLVLWHDCSGDARIPDVLRRAFLNFAGHVKKHPLKNWGWSRWRMPCGRLRRVIPVPRRRVL